LEISLLYATFFLFVIFYFWTNSKQRNFSIRIDFVEPLPDYFGVMLPAILTITAAFHFMALHSPGCPFRFAHFSFLFFAVLIPALSTIIATVSPAVDT
jgi:hypothetical protein